LFEQTTVKKLRSQLTRSEPIHDLAVMGEVTSQLDEIDEGIRKEQTSKVILELTDEVISL